MCKWGDETMVEVPVERDPRGEHGFRWDWRYVDECLATLIEELNAHGLFTRACCCGHGKDDGSVLFWDLEEMKLPRKALAKMAVRDIEASISNAESEALT